jgi:hypothetical protein
MPSCISIYAGRDDTDNPIAGASAAAFKKAASKTFDEIGAANNWRDRTGEANRLDHGVAAYLEHRPFR